MTLPLTTLLVPALLSLALAACLWLLLNAKAESQHRDSTLDRRLSLLEERMERLEQNTQSARSGSVSTSTSSPAPNFEIEVALSPQLPSFTKLSAGTSASTALLRAAEPAQLMPDQLDFLASLRNGGLVKG